MTLGPRVMLRCGCLGGLALLLAACEVPHASVSPEGDLEVFGPQARFSEQGPPDSWVFRGLSAEDRPFVFSAAQSATGPVLSVRTTEQPYLAVRRTRARLLATPFLAWEWRMGGHDGETHPVRIVVGFHGGDPKSGSLGSQPFAYLGDPVPPFDRALHITWHQSALTRGTIFRSEKTPRYVARGGLENTGRWWQEALDLSDIYRRIWPRDEMVDVTVTFIGFAAGPDSRAVTGEFSNFRLTR